MDTGPHILYEANSGCIRFEVRLVAGSGIATFALTERDEPEKELFKVVMQAHGSCMFFDKTYSDPIKSQHFTLPHSITAEYTPFWLSWYSNKICFGVEGQSKPFFDYKYRNRDTNIGFIKFLTACPSWPVDWYCEATPVILDEIEPVAIKSGELTWKKMVDNTLPCDALIGGIEDEPMYIARARHNGSLCPGKYVRSQNLAYVPWGGQEHSKSDFEILCGYNARWVDTSCRNIPENAFEAGISERYREPLYIGRAIVDGNIINGKVHVQYGTCYLPYKGREVELGHYQILVTSTPQHGIPTKLIRRS